MQEILDRLENKIDRLQAVSLTDKEVWNYQDLAGYTGFSKGHLYNLVAEGEIPHYKPLGGKVFFKRSEIEDWLLQNRVCSNQELEEKAING